MCRVLQVSRSGYYSFLQGVARGGSARAQANRRLLEEIRRIHEEVDGLYGAPRMHRRLREKGIACSRGRVERVMRGNEIRAKTVRGSKKITTHSTEGERQLRPDLLRRRFGAAGCAHEVWMGDVTYLWTEEGWVYLAAVLDLYSRAVVGWAAGERLDTHLAAEALCRAFVRYDFVPRGTLVFHSDRGTTYTSEAFERLLREQAVVHSYAYSCFDNAVVESFFHTLKSECTQFHVYHTREQARASLFRYIEIFYNRRRLHSSLGYRSPEAVLQQYQQRTAA
jgi:transposase InsO family protein